jgi:hypothetical protein
MKAIEAAIQRLEREKAEFNAKIDGKIEGLREALRIQAGDPSAQMEEAVRRRTRRGNLKQTVIDLLTEVGDKGLNAESCVPLAKSKGVDLLQGSVSSLLSRLKNDDIVFFDGSRYRLKKFAGPRHAA